MVRRRTYLALLAGGVVGGLTEAGRAGARSLTVKRAQTRRVTATQAAELVPPVDEFDRFGVAAALSGDTALVGAPGDDNTNGNAAGAVYVFERTDGSWHRRTKLLADTGSEDDGFGTAVALEGDTALIGTPYAVPEGTDIPGVTYVFERADGTWSQRAELTVADGAALLGSDVALSGTTALLGAPEEDNRNGDDAGAAYVFGRIDGEWNRQAKLTDTRGRSGDNFGTSVALDGDTALVGAPEADGLEEERAGRGVVFGRTDGSWDQQTILAPEDQDRNANFGVDVTLDGDRALVGDNFSEVLSEDDRGAVYGFARQEGTWRHDGEFTGIGGEPDDDFGAQVVLNDGRALVGAPNLTAEASDTSPGAAYVFERVSGEWERSSKLTPANAERDDSYGGTVLLTGDTALVGDRRANTVYVFTLDRSGRTAPDVTGDGNRARDPDQDGRFEDVNGDGETTPGDATVLFDSVFEGDATVMENTSLFDFNGDGTLTPGDATVLFDEIF